MKKDLIDIGELSVAEIDELVATACDIMANPEKYTESCKGLKLATLFYEPSTRTRLSFEAAMYELGGNVLGFSDADCSSAAKGETVEDTARTVSCYADIIAMRHPVGGTPLRAAQVAAVPVINAGDGGRKHPTQTLADICTIWKEKGRLQGLTIGCCGDLKYGRTVHSLVEAMSRYADIKFIMISPEELRLPDYIKQSVKGSISTDIEETADLQAVLPQLDILYMTRVQRERFNNEADYLRLKDSYILNAERMQQAKQDMIVLHPLPRVKEIAVEVDADPRACYFKQVLYGKYMRMALILKLLGRL